MSVVEFERPMDRRSVRRRLFNPPNGRISDEREIVAEPEARRRRIQTTLQWEREKRERQKAARLLELQQTMEEIEARRQKAEAEAAQAADDAGVALPPKLSAIMREVSDRYKVTPLDLISSRRTADVVLPRQIVIYLARHLTTLSLPAIGQRMGGRDHTTALHAVNKIKGLVENHPHLAAELDDIKRSLGVPA